MRKTFIVLLILYVTIMANCTVVLAAEEEEPAVDVIFIMDLSGSMLDSDAEKVSLMSVAMFVDFLDDSSSQVGYVLFGTDVVKSMPLTPVGQAKSKIRNNVLTSDFNEDWTNVPAGLDSALSLFKQSNSANRKMAILFTDGNVKMPRGGGLTHAQGEEKCREIAQAYKEAGIPLYTVGLNYDGNLNLDFIQGLSEISSSPGLSAKSYEAKTNWDIPEIFAKIFINVYNGNADIGLKFNSKEKMQTAVFSADEGIYELNVILVHRNKLDKLTIRRPDGQEYRDASFTQRDGYSFVKIRYPATGDWEFSFQGDYISANKLVRYITNVDSMVTITFDTDDGEPLDNIRVPLGRSLQDVPKPIKKGFSFEGWYLNEARTQLLTDGHTFSRDTLLYAKWMPQIMRNITFTGDGIELRTLRFPDGDRFYNHLEKAPFRKGYEFGGWYLDSGVRLDENSLITQDLTLTAQWNKIHITLVPTIIFLILAAVIFIGGLLLNKILTKKHLTVSGEISLRIFACVASLFVVFFSVACWLFLKEYIVPIEIMSSLPARNVIGSFNFVKSIDIFTLWGGLFIPLILNILLSAVLPSFFVTPASRFGKERQYLIHFIISFGGLIWPVVLWILYGIGLSIFWLIGYSLVVYTMGFFLSALLFRQGNSRKCSRFFFEL